MGQRWGLVLLTKNAKHLKYFLLLRPKQMVKKASEELIEEIERKLDLFLSDPEVSEERKAEVVRKLLEIAIGEM